MSAATKLLAMLGGCAALLGAAAAPAQLAPGYSGFSTAPREGTTELFWYSLRDLGECFATRKTRDARTLLATELGSPEEAQAAKRLWGRYTMCLRAASRMQASTVMIRGAIAEGLYKKDNSAPPPAVKVAQPAAIAKGAESSIQPYRLLADFSRCLAASHPDAVHRLLTTTRLGEAASGEAIAALAPDFDECLPPNVRIEFPPGELRLALAEALYNHARGQVGVARGK